MDSKEIGKFAAVFALLGALLLTGCLASGGSTYGTTGTTLSSASPTPTPAPTVTAAPPGTGNTPPAPPGGWINGTGNSSDSNSPPAPDSGTTTTTGSSGSAGSPPPAP